MDLNASLIGASETGDIENVRRLLSQLQVNPNSNSTDTGGELRSALHRAAAHGHLEIVQSLLQAGANPGQESSARRTALHEACIGGHHELVQCFVACMGDKGVDVRDGNGQTACHLAAFNGEVKCVKILLQHGSDPLVGDKDGRTVAHLSCTRNHNKVLTLLFQFGVDLARLDKHGKSPLHVAASNGSLDCISTLIDCDEDINQKDKQGASPHHYAAAHNHLKCIKLMAKQGAKMQALDKRGRAAIHYAAKNGAIDVLHWLLQLDVSIDLPDDDGLTALHWAVRTGKGECANCLLQHGADLAAANRNEEDVRQCARRYGHPKLLKDVMENVVCCPLCKRQYEIVAWEQQHQPGPMQQFMHRQAKSGYCLPNTITPKRKPAADSRDSSKQTPQRYLAAKYYGVHPQQLEDDRPDNI